MRVFDLLPAFGAMLLAGAASANVEKVVFVAPSISADAHQPCAAVCEASRLLHRLTPDSQDDGAYIGSSSSSTWRTELPAAFPWTAEAGAGAGADAETEPNNAELESGGAATWLLLDRLEAGRRYELRICWPATQPTAFSLDLFRFDEVTASPKLTASLQQFARLLPPSPSFSSAQQSTAVSTLHPPPASSPTFPGLLLLIRAAADFVTANRSLMDPSRVPPVNVDLILDAYVPVAAAGGLLPRSLVPTVAGIVLVVAASAALARLLAKWLQRVAEGQDANGGGDIWQDAHGDGPATAHGQKPSRARAKKLA